MNAANDTLLVAGVDVGSSAIKVVVLEDREGEDPRVRVTRRERIRRRDPKEVAETLFGESLEQAGVKQDDLDYIATTGESESVEFRTGHFYGMTTHARGGLFLGFERPESLAGVRLSSLLRWRSPLRWRSLLAWRSLRLRFRSPWLAW